MNDQIVGVVVIGIVALIVVCALTKFFPQTDDGSKDSTALDLKPGKVEFVPDKDEPAAVPPHPEEKAKAEEKQAAPKPPTRWHMEPPAKMVIEIELDRIPPSMALGSLLQMQDIVKAFYQEQAQKAAQLKNRIVRPSMVDRTEAILRRPS